MQRASAIAGALLLFFGVLTIWVPGRWPATVLEAGFFALAVIWLIKMGFSSRRFESSILLLPLGLAPLWGLLQLVLGQTVYRYETWNAVLHWSAILCAFWVGLQVFENRRLRRSFRAAILYFGFAIALLSALQVFTSKGKVFWIFETPYQDNVLGPFLSRNNYASFVILLLPGVLTESFRDRRRSLFWTAAAATMYASVIAGASRAGFVIATVEVVLIPLLVWARHQAPARAVGGLLLKLAVLLVVFVAVVGWGVLWDRFLQPGSYPGRWEFVLSSLAMVKDRPWMGYGLGTWPTVYPAYALREFPGLVVHHAHNEWVQWAAEGGVPFFLLLLFVFAWSLRPALRSIWGAGIVAVFLHALVDYPFLHIGLGVWPFALLAMLAQSQRDETRYTRSAA